MSTVLVRQDLGSEGTSYVTAYLQANTEFGKQLGRLLLATHDIEAGTAWAFVPSPVPKARRAPLTDFETGGLVSRREGTWSAQLQGWWKSLGASKAGFVCVEGALERPSDPFLETFENPVFFCGESVFSYGPLDSDEPPPWFGGATWNPNVAVVAAAPAKPPADRDYIEQRELMRLAADAAAVVIGAWDDDGLVTWEPSAS